MYSVWWRSLFLGLFTVIVIANIAFTFNAVTVINPSSLSLDYSEYYFGMSSFIESFKSWFGNNDFLKNFYDAIRTVASFTSKTFYTYSNPYLATNGLAAFGYDGKNVLIAVLSLLTFATNIIPMLLMVVIGLLYILYLIFFFVQIILFIIAFMGGSFATPLPSTDWYDSYSQFGYDWSDTINWWNQYWGGIFV